MLTIQEESHDGHSKIQERPIRRKQQQQQQQQYSLHNQYYLISLTCKGSHGH